MKKIKITRSLFVYLLIAMFILAGCRERSLSDESPPVDNGTVIDQGGGEPVDPNTGGSTEGEMTEGGEGEMTEGGEGEMTEGGEGEMTEGGEGEMTEGGEGEMTEGGEGEMTEGGEGEMTEGGEGEMTEGGEGEMTEGSEGATEGGEGEATEGGEGATEGGEGAATEGGEGASAGGSVHIVQSGETLGEIAELYGVSVNALATHNNIVNINAVQIGQELSIPTAEEAAAIDSGSREEIVHIVSSGDTLQRIANRYDVTLQELIDYNGIENANSITIGQEIRIPPR